MNLTKPTVAGITKSFSKMVAQLDALIEARQTDNERLETKQSEIAGSIGLNITEITQARSIKAKLEDLIA